MSVPFTCTFTHAHRKVIICGVSVQWRDPKPPVLVKKPQVICCKHIEQDTQQVAACNDGSQGGRCAHCWGLSLCLCVRWGCNCMVCVWESVYWCVSMFCFMVMFIYPCLWYAMYARGVFLWRVCVCARTHVRARARQRECVSAVACSCRFIGMLHALQRCGT